MSSLINASLVTRETHAVAPASAYEMAMRSISDPLCDPAKLQALLAVRDQWEAAEARKAFNSAVVEFQNRCPIIEKGDKAYDKMYARIDRIWRTIRPLMQETGLAVTWEGFKEIAGVVHLDGHLVHRDGHSQALHHEIPLPDQIKGMNATQRSGAAETYAKRYAMCAALGIQTGDDDDGNAGKVADVCDAKQCQLLRDLCAEVGRREEQVCAVYSVKAFEALPAFQFLGACNQLEGIKARRGKEAVKA